MLALCVFTTQSVRQGACPTGTLTLDRVVLPFVTQCDLQKTKSKCCWGVYLKCLLNHLILWILKCYKCTRLRKPPIFYLRLLWVPTTQLCWFETVRRINSNTNLNTKNKHQEQDVGGGKALPTYPVSTWAKREIEIKPGTIGNELQLASKNTLQRALFSTIP